MKITGKFAPLLFSAGVLAGVLGVQATMSVGAAFAHESGTTMKSMGMMSKSAGDTEMNAAMTRMQTRMSAITMTGNQDRDFMLMMIPHHLSATEMAKVELARGSRPELKALARDVISSQNREISQMRGWLKSWYGAASH